MKKWEILSSKHAFFHKWYKVIVETIKLPNGEIIDDYFLSDRPDVVLIFALTTDNQVVLVEQYKHGAQQVLVELPGGVVDENEQAEVAAKRELLEETGFVPKEIEYLGVFNDDPTKNRNTLHFYVAKDCEKVSKQKLDVLEDVTVLLKDVSTLKDWLRNQKINTCSSLALSHLALDHLDIR